MSAPQYGSGADPRRALVTGITGQTGSYLAELLLAEGYEVHGLVRRVSSFNTSRIDHVFDRLQLHHGDMLDASSLRSVLGKARPDEIYNLAAQSHVHVSFDVPEHTADVTGMGCLRLLEAVREVCPSARFYQASSSEMFGKVVETPQTEATPFYPRSPYGAAKCFAFHMTKNYREAYGLFAVNGICFNHECVSERTPLLIRRSGAVDVLTVDELVPLLRKGKSVQTFEIRGVEIWDGVSWTEILTVTATRRRTLDKSHQTLSIETRGGIVEATAHHKMLDDHFEEVEAGGISKGDRLALFDSFPEMPSWTVLTSEMAEFLGLLMADGYVSPEKGIQFTKNDLGTRDRVAALWRKLFLGVSRTDHSPSGFGEKFVAQLYLSGCPTIVKWLRSQLYTKDGLKRVPQIVLNGTIEIKKSFLDGYYRGDGLKAGNGESVKTNSAVLAQGVCWLYASLGRACTVYAEHRDGKVYYQLNIAAEARGKTGQHLRKDPAEVMRVRSSAVMDEWVFDLETSSRRFSAGVGRVIVHNSPRRGETFVTRKITRAVGRIAADLQGKLLLGNLDAERDWGFAGCYARAMWLSLQRDVAEDYVVATGEKHSVREFLEAAFARVGLDWKKYVEVDRRYLRPSEVDLLIGDASKARRELGWVPRVSFVELVNRMVDADVRLARVEAAMAERVAAERVAAE